MMTLEGAPASLRAMKALFVLALPAAALAGAPDRAASVGCSGRFQEASTATVSCSGEQFHARCEDRGDQLGVTLFAGEEPVTTIDCPAGETPKERSARDGALKVRCAKSGPVAEVFCPSTVGRYLFRCTTTREGTHARIGVYVREQQQLANGIECARVRMERKEPRP